MRFRKIGEEVCRLSAKRKAQYYKICLCVNPLFFLSLQASLRWQRISWHARQVPAMCPQNSQSPSNTASKSGDWKDPSLDILWIPTSLLQSHLKASSGRRMSVPSPGQCAGAAAPVSSLLSNTLGWSQACQNEHKQKDGSMDRIELMNNRWVRSTTFVFQWRESAQSSWIQLGCCTETKDPSYSFSIWTPAPRSGSMAKDRPGLWVSWGLSVQHPAGSTALSGGVDAQGLMFHLWRSGLSVPRAFFLPPLAVIGLDLLTVLAHGTVLCPAERLSTSTNISMGWVCLCLEMCRTVMWDRNSNAAVWR